MTNAVSIAQLGANNSSFTNRIINGGMVIDQRNAGASVSSGFSVDRFGLAFSVGSKFTAQQNAGSVTPPAGFTNYLGCTSSSAYSISSGDYFNIYQNIEGFNSADLGWGTANAQTVTLSFWVRSSLTGTFGGSLRNSSANYSYPFSFSIPLANTWTQISITIVGPTTGTWVGATNGTGIGIYFALGVGSTYSGTAGSWSANNYLSATGATSVVGTNGATFYITGVQLEKGSTATSFDYRPYGTELMLCQRYYTKSYNVDVAPGTNTSDGSFAFYATAVAGETSGSTRFPVTMRAAPTVTLYTPAGTSGAIRNVSDSTNDTGAVATSIGQNGWAYIGGNRIANKIYQYHYIASIEL